VPLQTSGAGTLRAVDRLCVVTVAFTYVVSVVWAFIEGNAQAWGLLAVPGLGFLLLSWARARIDAPRPYELAAVNPLLDSSTHGKSFPSRHVGSGALIGSSLVFVHPLLGIGVLLVTLVLAFVRVAGRVHFVRDVVAGYIAGIAFGFAGMFLFTLIIS
jgi:membrane-associated phospholipid phosphatase